MSRLPLCTITRSTGCSIVAGPARPASESACAPGASGTASTIKIKSLRNMSRDIITPRAQRAGSVRNQLDRFTVSRGGIGDQAVVPARLELGGDGEAPHRAALRD